MTVVLWVVGVIVGLWLLFLIGIIASVRYTANRLVDVAEFDEHCRSAGVVDRRLTAVEVQRLRLVAAQDAAQIRHPSTGGAR